MHNTRSTRGLSTSLLVVALALAGCSAKASIGTKETPEAEVEDTVATQLAENTGQPKPNIDCPTGLEAKVGTVITCTLSVDGDPKRYPVTVTVDSVADGRSHFTAKVGTEPLP
jgi:hypothetical protein